MGRIFYIMGKSVSGKDTIYRQLIQDKEFGFRKLVPYTTRPIRSGEKDGEDYFFTDEAGLEKIRQEGKLVELRTYQTAHGPWHYFTVDDGHIDLAQYSYLAIGTLESYQSLRAYFGKEMLVPVFIDLDDGVRLQRALDRERMQESPKYKEMCRRYLADLEDFSEEKVAAAGIEKRFFNNNELTECIEKIKIYIREIWNEEG